MSHTIDSLMHTNVHTASIDDSIAAVEKQLKDHELSWVPVVEPGGPVLGVISASDLLQFHAQRRDPQHVLAWQLCTYKPITVSPRTSVAEVARLMVRHHIHHVVVMDGQALCGVVSALDFVGRFVVDGQPG